MTLKNLNSPYLLGLANLANYEASCFRQWVEPDPKDAHMISQLCLVRRKQYCLNKDLHTYIHTILAILGICRFCRILRHKTVVALCSALFTSRYKSFLSTRASVFPKKKPVKTIWTRAVTYLWRHPKCRPLSRHWVEVQSFPRACVTVIQRAGNG